MKFPIVVGIVFNAILSINAFAQKDLKREDLIPYAQYFQLKPDHQLPSEIHDFFSNELAQVQFVGIAEVHQSQQLSYFTIGFLQTLHSSGFRHFALELGPYSAKALMELTKEPQEVSAKIREVNRQYGKNSFPKIPLVFVDKKEDAVFVQQAAQLGYDFWGLDQEFTFSYELHLDRIYQAEPNKSNEKTKLYENCKALLKKTIFKNKISGTTKNCWLLNHQKFSEFFHAFSSNPANKQYIEHLKESMDIYCKQETGRGGSQQRADYMKKNFKEKYEEARQREDKPKVLLKMGGVHLTHGISTFGVNDIGKYINDFASQQGTSFMTIRHLTRFKNGKDELKKKKWKNVALLTSLGVRDQWTLIDLRPMRKLVQDGKFSSSKSILFEINSYDFVLIPPNDRIGKLNY